MNKKQAKKLFKKYNRNECSVEELQLLDRFLDSYQKESQAWPELVFGKEKDFKQQLWNKIESEINKDVKRKKYAFKSYYIYTAAASIVLFVAITFLINKGIFSMEPQNNDQIVVENQIKMGTDKATLTLEDGTTVALEKGKSYTANHLNSTGEALVYEYDEENPESELVYNYLTIPRGGQFFIKLSDGTQVWLNSETQLKYPVQFVEGKPRVVELVYGEAYFDVSPSTTHKGANFSVVSKGQNVEVLGTEFNVKAYRDEERTYTTLVEGKVQLNALGNEMLLKPNDQTILDHKTRTVETHVADVYSETSWKNGVFSFRNKSLKEIMRVLSRWYDVDVVFENKLLEDKTFKGVLAKNQRLEDILSILKSSSSIKTYEINNKTIILR